MLPFVVLSAYRDIGGVATTDFDAICAEQTNASIGLNAPGFDSLPQRNFSPKCHSAGRQTSCRGFKQAWLPFSLSADRRLNYPSVHEGYGRGERLRPYYRTACIEGRHTAEGDPNFRLSQAKLKLLWLYLCLWNRMSKALTLGCVECRNLGVWALDE